MPSHNRAWRDAWLSESSRTSTRHDIARRRASARGWGEPRSGEHGKRVGSSRTFGITDQGALGVLPGFKQEACKVRRQQDYALGERRRREDTKSVGSPTTQRNVVRGQAGIVIGTQ